MIYPIIFIVALVLIMIYSRPETRSCRWRMDKRRDTEEQSFFRCVACGAEVMSDTGKPPQTCMKT
ncbi:MAG: hypothetical protein ACU0FH_07470 [Heliomarina sp.]|uniref:hypothetical protein n=1 Tax=Heliomarina sp. TaxID=2917556 RepID=UPI00405990DB